MWLSTVVRSSCSSFLSLKEVSARFNQTVNLLGCKTLICITLSISLGIEHPLDTPHLRQNLLSDLLPSCKAIDRLIFATDNARSPLPITG